jgi:PAS domain S-box-containing protein
MKEQGKTQEQLIGELSELRQRVAQLETAEAERERAEQALSASKEYTKNIIDSSLDMIIACGTDRCIIEFNRAAQHTFGYCREEVIGKHVDMLYADPQEGRIIHEMTLQKGKCVREIRDRRKNGEEFPAFLSASTLCSADNEIVGVMGVARDITERKRAEDSLRESEEFLRQIVDTSPNSIFVKDSGGRYVLVNRMQAELYGATPEIIVSKTDQDLVEMSLLSAEEAGRFIENDRKVLLHQRPVVSVEESLTLPDGTTRYFQTVKVPLTLEGDPKYLLGIAADITERKQTEEALRRRTAQLEALREVGLEITAQLELDALLHSIVSRSIELLRGTEGGLYLYRPERDVLEWTVAIGPYTDFVGSILRRGEGLSGKILETGEPLIVDDYQTWEGRASIYDAYPFHAIVGVPICWGEELLGVLNVMDDTPSAFAPADAELLSSLATQAAIAIRNAHLYEAERKRATQLAVVNQVAQKAVSILEPDHLLEEIVTAIQQGFGYHNVILLQLDETGTRLGSQAIAGGFKDVAPPDYCQDVGEGLLGRAAVTERPVVVNDVTQDPNYVVGFTEKVPTRSEMCIPLKLADRVVGVLDVQETRTNAFDETDLTALETLAGQIAIAIDNARLYQAVKQELGERTRAEEALRQRNRDLAMLNRASQALISILELDQVIISVLEEVRRLLDVVACSVWLVDPKTEELICRQATGPQSAAVRGWRLAPGQGITGWVSRSGESLIVPDTRADERYYSGVEERIGLTLRSILSVPLRVKEDVIGVLQILDTQVARFSKSDLELVEPLAAAAAIAIENAQLYEQTRRDAETRAILLHEINHRVKNNLTGIIGLLYTARRRAKVEDQATYESTMDDLIGRVRGLATAHTMLSASGWDPLPLNDLVARIIRACLVSLPHDRRVSVAVSPSPVRVTSDQAHNLALVINELTTNTIKHALGTRNTAHITCQITLDDETVCCEFRDDGPGYSQDVLQPGHHNVGFDLIQKIVRKGLRGELSLHNDRGAVTTIRFKAKT